MTFSLDVPADCASHGIGNDWHGILRAVIHAQDAWDAGFDGLQAGSLQVFAGVAGEDDSTRSTGTMAAAPERRVVRFIVVGWWLWVA